MVHATFVNAFGLIKHLIFPLSFCSMQHRLNDSSFALDLVPLCAVAWFPYCPVLRLSADAA